MACSSPKIAIYHPAYHASEPRSFGAQFSQRTSLSCKKSWQHRSSFLQNGLQHMGRNSQNLKYCRGDLCRLHGSSYRSWLQSRIGNKKRHVSVLIAESAMARDGLIIGRRIDGAESGNKEEVG